MHWRWILGGASAVLVASGYYFALSAPANFPSGSLVVVATGATAGEVAENFGAARVIRQPFLLRVLLRAKGEGGGIQAGVYRFAVPQNLLTVAYRLVAGDFGLPPVRITFIEGATVRDMTARVQNAFPFITGDFSLAARPYEGYLFPDTYFFAPSVAAETVVAAMRDNFSAKITSLESEIRASGHSLSDVVIMASLVEKEARTDVNRRIVAGILWNRLARGMPLQVDAVFGYIYGRDTYSPSLADLQTDSPYNTYRHKGLPPGPINNPGLDALTAVLNPTKTNYVYYLTGRDDLMHYATTYAEHQANRQKYLN